MNGEEILNEVKEIIGDANYFQYREINRAYKRLANITSYTWLRKQSESLLTFKADTSEYILNMDGIRQMKRIWVHGVDSGDQFWNLLEEAPEMLFEDKRRQSIDPDGTETSGLPSWYRIISEENNALNIKITPIPDEELRGRVDYIKTPATIDRTSEPDMPPDYHYLISELAAGYILEKKDDARADRYINRAEKEARAMIADSQPGRIKDVDRKKYPLQR